MKSRFSGVLCACVLAFVVSEPASAASIPGRGTWETTLQARTFDGTTIGGYYDTALNITWLANANYVGTTMDWINANSWAASLNLNGITGWRLPTMGPVNGSSFTYSYGYDGTHDQGYNMGAPGTAYAGSTGSEMAHLFYTTLGDKAFVDTSGVYPQFDYGLSNTGPFSNLQSYSYWSATEYAPNTGNAWDFVFENGGQDNYYKAYNNYAWAVHAGDVGAAVVPVPAAI
jgi:hypothetical protein